MDQSEPSPRNHDNVPVILTAVDTPTRTVGISTATSHGNNLTNLSFAKWKVELRNTMANLKNKRASTGMYITLQTPWP